MFERVLFEAAASFGWRVHAVVIMRNHFHLAVETPEPNLSRGMKWLQGPWTVDGAVQSVSRAGRAAVSGAVQGAACRTGPRHGPGGALQPASVSQFVRRLRQVRTGAEDGKPEGQSA